MLSRAHASVQTCSVLTLAGTRASQQKPSTSRYHTHSTAYERASAALRAVMHSPSAATRPSQRMEEQQGRRPGSKARHTRRSELIAAIAGEAAVVFSRRGRLQRRLRGRARCWQAHVAPTAARLQVEPLRPPEPRASGRRGWACTALGQRDRQLLPQGQCASARAHAQSRCALRGSSAGVEKTTPSSACAMSTRSAACA